MRTLCCRIVRVCSRAQNTLEQQHQHSNNNTNTLTTGTIVIWILQPIFADMDKVFFGQRSEEEENMSCTRALQTMSWSEACQRYFKVLEFGDEMNADLLAQVMGCDVKTGRKRGRTRCWTQAELLARKDSVSSSSSSRTWCSSA